jgi:hypothetical protein
MDGNSSTEGNTHSRLQWANVPCKPISQVPVRPLCPATLECPYNNRGGNATEENALGTYVPGQPLGRQCGAPFFSTECHPEVVISQLPKPLMRYPCKDTCKAWSGPVNRYWNYPCLRQCPSGCPLPDYINSMNPNYPFC